MGVSKNMIDYMEQKEYDPLELVGEHPALVTSAIIDHPELSDDLVVKCIDASGDKFLETIPDKFLESEIVQRRISKLKLTLS